MYNEEYLHCEIDKIEPYPDQPKRVQLKLKQHQLRLLNACLKLENNRFKEISALEEGSPQVEMRTNLGFICDKVGSGKSFTILSIISEQPELKPKYQYLPLNDSRSTYTYINELVKISPTVNPNLIVVPRGIFNQWEDYLDDYTDFETESVGPRTKMPIVTEDSTTEVILISDSRYNEFVKVNCDQTFPRIFFDEPDTLKIANCQNLKSAFYWFISSSYANCQHPNGKYHYDYNHGYAKQVELKGIPHNGFIKNVCRSLFINSKTRMLFLKNSDAFVDQSNDLSDYQVEKIICKTDQILNVLNGVIDDTVKQMICAGNIDAALEHFGGEKQTESSLITLVTQDFRRTLDNLRLEYEFCQKKAYNVEKQRQDMLERLEEKINQTEEKIKFVEDRIKSEGLDPILHIPIEHPVITKCCNNKFDFESIGEIIGGRHSMCPMCRKPLTSDSVIIIKTGKEGKEKEGKEDDKEEDETEDELDRPYVYKENDKNDNLVHLLTRVIPRGKKVLVFSEHDATYQYLKQLVKIRELSGTTDAIRKTVDEYRRGNLNILFLNARYYGSGLNLENTDYIIIYHQLTSEVLEQQVIGRAQRIGRKSRLKVIKLLFPGEGSDDIAEFDDAAVEAAEEPNPFGLDMDEEIEEDDEGDVEDEKKDQKDDLDMEEEIID